MGGKCVKNYENYHRRKVKILVLEKENRTLISGEISKGTKTRKNI